MLVGAVLLIDSVFYSAIVPILGDLSDEFSIGKGRAGLLVGMYAVGMIAAAYPAAKAAARWDGRRCVAAGLVTMSLGCLLFAFSDGITGLMSARLIQGLGGSLSWVGGLAWLSDVAPSGGRAKMLGTALGIGVFGSQLGPVVGVIAGELGRGPAFALGAVAGGILGGWALSRPTPGVAAVVPSSPVRQIATSDFNFGFALTVLASICLGVVDVLTPLQLSDRDVSSAAIGAIFFAASGTLAIVGRWTGSVIDRRGVGLPVVVASAASLAAMATLSLTRNELVMALAIVVGSGGLGALWVPGTQLLSVAAHAKNVDESYAFGAFLLAWALGFAVGANTCGALADAGGPALPYLIGCALCVMTGGYGLACLTSSSDTARAAGLEGL